MQSQKRRKAEVARHHPGPVPPGPAGTPHAKSNGRLSTGIQGLDDVLGGGLTARRAYLVRGGPGTGKTTLGLHFAAAGVSRAEKVLFITLGEPEEEIRRDAEALGFDLDGIAFLDLSPTSISFAEARSYDVFATWEVEREPVVRRIFDALEALAPERVFLDAVTLFRYLTPDAFQFRRQVLSFVRFMVERGATVLFTSEASDQAPDDDLQFISDGVICLDFLEHTRTVSVRKFRGSHFESGVHSLRLTAQGMEVYPRLIPVTHGREFPAGIIPSGVPELDKLLHGGIERGAVTLVSGPSGAGKTTIGMQFVKEAAQRGERSVVYAFEESADTLLRRCEAIGIPVKKMMDEGTLSVVQVEPLRLTPDEFAHMVRKEVEERGARIVMIDSISGYRLSLHGEDLVVQLHALSKYMKNMGVTPILVSDVEAITGDFRLTEIGISYLADNIVFLRYFEMGGSLRRAIGVLKKRMSGYEESLREIEILPKGVKIGRPLTALRGVLSGAPVMVG